MRDQGIARTRGDTCWVIVALATVAALLLSACSALPSHDPAPVGSASTPNPTVAAPTPIGQAHIESVTTSGRVAIDVPNVGSLSGSPGSFTEEGELRATPVAIPAAIGVTGLTITSPGIEVSLQGTTLRRPLAVSFPAPAGRPGSMPVLVHRADSGNVEVLPGQLVKGRILVSTTHFSAWWPASLDIRKWFKDRADSAVNAILGRTDPGPCANSPLSWATMNKQTNLLHACLWNNRAADGADRAEIKLKSNRRTYMWVRVPSGTDYIWRGSVDDAFVATKLAQLFDNDRADTVLLSGGQEMSAGYRRPGQSGDKSLSAYIDYHSMSVSLLASLLDLGGDIDGKLGVVFLLAGCTAKLGTSASGISSELLKCAVERAVTNLDDPNKSFAAAMNLFGERAYAEAAGRSLQRAAGTLRLLGGAFKVVLLGGIVRDIWTQTIDAFFQALDQRNGDVILHLTGATSNAGPPQEQAGSGPRPQPAGGTLSVSFSENPFRCDGGVRALGTLSGAAAGERITFSSPEVSGLLPGTASASGTLPLRWQCDPGDVGTTWHVTATGQSSGRRVTFSVGSVGAPAPPPPAPAAAGELSSNYGSANKGYAMCRGNPGNSLSMPGGTVEQTFTAPSGSVSVTSAMVQIDPAAEVTAHMTLLVNGQARASATAQASGDPRFNLGSVAVSGGDSLTLRISFTATAGKIITVYTAGAPGGTFRTFNSCPDGAPTVTRSDTGLRAVVYGTAR